LKRLVDIAAQNSNDQERIRTMTFLFNSDAARGRIFQDAFAREIPDLPFSMDPATVDPERVRYLMTWTVPEIWRVTAISKCCFRPAPVSTSSAPPACPTT
jgi:glyoxylate/hydroxypyruvate reductase A